MREIKLTFIVHDYEQNRLHCCQLRTTRRTVGEAWLMFRDRVLVNYFECPLSEAENRFALVGTFRGLTQWIDERIPLRAPTREEIKQLSTDKS